METATKTKKATKPYIEAVGRRKTAVARVRLVEAGRTKIVVNNRDVADYFPTEEMQSIVRDALSKIKMPVKFSVSVLVRGGGLHAQAEALRHGIARALVKYDEEVRGTLKKLSFLKRDPRVKERKKFGLKKARKSPQWSKR